MLKRTAHRIGQAILDLDGLVRIAVGMVIGAWLPTLILLLLTGMRAIIDAQPALLFFTTLLLVASVRALLMDVKRPGAPAPGEPVVGYRLWTLKGARLYSWLGDEEWPSATPMTSWNHYADAACVREQLRSLPSLSRVILPHLTNMVGVHAVKRIVWLPIRLPRLLAALSPHDDAFKVFGEVNLWGRVVEEQKGFRGEFGYPRRLIGGGKRVRQVAAHYGVPYVSQWRWLLEGVYGSRRVRQNA